MGQKGAWPRSRDLVFKFWDPLISIFIGCQDICENALHWFMLEVLPKKRFLGHKWGVVNP